MRADQDPKFVETFSKFGFVSAGWVSWEKTRAEYEVQSKKYWDWIHQNKYAEMGYLQRGLEFRLRPDLFFPKLKSVLVVLSPYSTVKPVQSEGFQYARYVNGPDYHKDLKQRLMNWVNALKETGQMQVETETKICVDTSAVLERTWASLAGLGWIGKNTMLIHPRLGSFHFIGVVFTDQEVPWGSSAIPDFCGHCNRCEKSCPTNAIQNHSVDSKNCISYRTLEKKNSFDDSVAHSGYLAGCDICQEVCPFNQKVLKSKNQGELHPYLNLSLNELIQESFDQYKNRVRESALNHVKPTQFDRNLKHWLVQARVEDRITNEQFRILVSMRISVLGSDAALNGWDLL